MYQVKLEVHDSWLRFIEDTMMRLLILEMIDFELVEIECINVVNFANYSLLGSIYEDAGKLRMESFRDFIIL